MMPRFMSSARPTVAAAEANANPVAVAAQAAGLDDDAVAGAGKGQRSGMQRADHAGGEQDVFARHRAAFVPRQHHLTLFPCSQCHKVLPLNTTPRQLVAAPHPAALQHGQGRICRRF